MMVKFKMTDKKWTDVDTQAFKASIANYKRKSSVEHYIQASLAYLEDQRYAKDQVDLAEQCMRTIANMTPLCDELDQDIAKDLVRLNPLTYTKSHWDRLDSVFKKYPYLYVKLKGPDVVRTLKLCTNRNRALSARIDTYTNQTQRGPITWDIIYPNE
jgi:hypothetical protein